MYKNIICNTLEFYHFSYPTVNMPLPDFGARKSQHRKSRVCHDGRHVVLSGSCNGHSAVLSRALPAEP